MTRDERIARALLRYLKRGRAERPKDCPRCNATARAIRLVQAQWVVAGIDLGEG